MTPFQLYLTGQMFALYGLACLLTAHLHTHPALDVLTVLVFVAVPLHLPVIVLAGGKK